MKNEINNNMKKTLNVQPVSDFIKINRPLINTKSNDMLRALILIELKQRKSCGYELEVLNIQENAILKEYASRN